MEFTLAQSSASFSADFSGKSQGGNKIFRILFIDIDIAEILKYPFGGLFGEQVVFSGSAFFLIDPSNNRIEFKHYKRREALY